MTVIIPERNLRFDNARVMPQHNPSSGTSPRPAYSLADDSGHGCPGTRCHWLGHGARLERMLTSLSGKAQSANEALASYQGPVSWSSLVCVTNREVCRCRDVHNVNSMARIRQESVRDA